MRQKRFAVDFYKRLWKACRQMLESGRPVRQPVSQPEACFDFTAHIELPRSSRGRSAHKVRQQNWRYCTRAFAIRTFRFLGR